MMRWQHPVPRYPAVLFLTLLLLSFPPNLAAQVSQGSIVGTIRVLRGNFPSTPVMVNLVARGALVNSIYADNEGRFGFSQLEPNVYHLVIEDKAYQKLEETVVIDPTTPVRFLSLTLVPLGLDRPENAVGISGGNPNLTDPSEYTRQIPKDARREFEKGVKADQDGKSDEAIRHFAKAIELAPDFYAARNNLGSAYVARSRFPEAQELFEKVIKVNPSDAAAYFNLANVYLLQRQYSQAEKWVTQGLRREPDSGFGNFLQGSLYSRTGRPREAEAALRRCLELSPLMSQAHLALVNLYLHEKRSQDAVSELRAFLQRFPEDPLAPKAKQVLDKLEVDKGTP